MEKDIGKIKKNDETNIILRVDDFGGRTGVTIREFVTSERYTGFTKSGVRILAADFPAFKEMINSISGEDLKEVPKEDETTPEGRVGGTPAETNLPKEQETLDKATQDY